MRHCLVTFASLFHYLCVAIPSKLCYFPVTFASLSRHLCVTVPSLLRHFPITFASLSRQNCVTFPSPLNHCPVTVMSPLRHCPTPLRHCIYFLVLCFENCTIRLKRPKIPQNHFLNRFSAGKRIADLFSCGFKPGASGW